MGLLKPIKRRIIRWVIETKFADAAKHSYFNLRWYYIEDVLENEMGEKMFIFSHRLVPVNKAKLQAYNRRLETLPNTQAMKVQQAPLSTQSKDSEEK